MNLASRIQKLEVKLFPAKEKAYFIGWANCRWGEAEGLIRCKSESIKDFQKRVLEVTSRKYIWVK